MNINVDKAVEELTLATLDGRIAEAANKDVAFLKAYFATLLASNANHNELTEQMPERM